jgi:hypothetical protein
MVRVDDVWWDLDDDEGSRSQHVGEHDVSKREVEEILRNPKNTTTTSRTSGEQITFGYTSDGRYLAVVWERVLDEPFTVYPITAYDVPEPSGGRAKKNRKR